MDGGQVEVWKIQKERVTWKFWCLAPSCRRYSIAGGMVRKAQNYEAPSQYTIKCYIYLYIYVCMCVCVCAATMLPPMRLCMPCEHSLCRYAGQWVTTTDTTAGWMGEGGKKTVKDMAHQGDMMHHIRCMVGLVNFHYAKHFFLAYLNCLKCKVALTLKTTVPFVYNLKVYFTLLQKFIVLFNKLKILIWKKLSNINRFQKKWLYLKHSQNFEQIFGWDCPNLAYNE